jgi:hypothetical protein
MIVTTSERCRIFAFHVQLNEIIPCLWSVQQEQEQHSEWRHCTYSSMSALLYVPAFASLCKRQPPIIQQ